MSNFNEHTLEMAIMELFGQQGYSYVNGETIHKEQTEVLLRDDLRMYLMDRYAQEGITPLEVERVIAKLTADNGAPLYEQNAQTYRLMTEGFAIKREDASQPDLFVEVIDFKDIDRNIIKIVNQLEIKGQEWRILRARGRMKKYKNKGIKASENYFLDLLVCEKKLFVKKTPHPPLYFQIA